MPIRGAKLAVGPFPLLVWAHGLDATVEYFDSLLRDWASAGYVVAAPTFPVTRAGGAGTDRFNDYVNQPTDVSTVITRVLQIDGSAGTVHRDLVDARRIAVAGHSLGAVTAYGLISNTCCIDARVRGAIEIDGAPLAFPHGRAIQRAVPVLLIHGDADTTFPVSESQSTYANARSPKYLVILHAAPHTPFEIGWARTIIINTVRDFLDAYLKQDPTGSSRLIGQASVTGRSTITAEP